MTSKFAVGQRVICKPNDTVPTMAGYFGHVAHLSKKVEGDQIILVSLSGRVGGDAIPDNLDPTGDDPFIFYESELEHAD